MMTDRVEIPRYRDGTSAGEMQSHTNEELEVIRDRTSLRNWLKCNLFCGPCTAFLSCVHVPWFFLLSKESRNPDTQQDLRWRRKLTLASMCLLMLFVIPGCLAGSLMMLEEANRPPFCAYDDRSYCKTCVPEKKTHIKNIDRDLFVH